MSSDVQKAQGFYRELLAQWAEQHEGYLEGTKNILNGRPGVKRLKGGR